MGDVRMKPVVGLLAACLLATSLIPLNAYAGSLLGGLVKTGSDSGNSSQIVSLGDFTQPPSSTAFMYAFGGGVESPIGPHLLANVGYRLSRVQADTPVHAQSVTFGIGYRF